MQGYCSVLGCEGAESIHRHLINILTTHPHLSAGSKKGQAKTTAEEVVMETGFVSLTVGLPLTSTQSSTRWTLT